jgi:hypothetical protein
LLPRPGLLEDTFILHENVSPPTKMSRRYPNWNWFSNSLSLRNLEVPGIRHVNLTLGVVVAIFCHMGQRGRKKVCRKRKKLSRNPQSSRDRRRKTQNTK